MFSFKQGGSMRYVVSTMTQNEVQTACDWAELEGWGPGLNDAQCFYSADNAGFFKGEFDGQIVAVGSMVCYDSHFAFSGLYIVKPEFRGRGFGLELTKARLNYAKDRCIGLDGVIENVHLYERLGYQSCFQNHRFKGPVSHTEKLDEHIKEATVSHLEPLILFDRHYFPARREDFLKAWINNRHAKALLMEKDGKILGFGVVRECKGPAKIGPLFAKNKDVANALLDALLNHTEAREYYLDVPGNNPAALELAKDRTLESVFSTMRMYRNGAPAIEHDGVFGITSFELG